MNEEYVKAFVDNIKRKVADLVAVNAELETVVLFKDAEIASLKAELEKLTPAEAPAAE